MGVYYIGGFISTLAHTVNLLKCVKHGLFLSSFFSFLRKSEIEYCM